MTAAQVRSELQRRIRAAILEQRIVLEDLAQRLNLLPVGAEVLLAQKDWSLETAFMIAEALGLIIEIEIEVRSP